MKANFGNCLKYLILPAVIFNHCFFAFLQSGPIETDLSFAVGYRCDNLHWTVTSAPVSDIMTEEKWKNLQILELGGKLETCIYKHLYLRAEGDYGWILAGNKTFDLDEIVGISGDEWLKASTRGDVYDVSGGVGYLSSFYSNQFQLTPIVGYSYSVQHFRDSDYKDVIHLLNLFEDATSSSTYQWFGPWAGLCFGYLHKFFKTSFEYQFHLSMYRGTIHDNLIDTDEETQKKNCTYGNEFTLRLFFPKWKHWAIGLVGNYEFYNGTNGSSTLDGQVSTLNGIHWNSGSISLNLVRHF